MTTPIASHSTPHSLEQLPLLLDINDIRLLFRVGRTAGYDLVRSTDFPPPVTLTGRTHRWVRDDVLSWMKTRQRHHRVARTVPASPAAPDPLPTPVPRAKRARGGAR